MEVPHLLALAGPAKRAGAFQTAHKCLIRWAVEGTWERILSAVLVIADAGDDVSWIASVDSTVCRAHQHSAGSRKGGRSVDPNPTIARSDARGGLSTKVYLASDSVRHNPWPSTSPQARQMKRRHLRRSWPGFGLRALGWGGPRSPTGVRPRRSRLLIPRDPCTSAPTRYSGSHSAVRRSGRPPSAAGRRGRSPRSISTLRHTSNLTPSNVHQSTQAVARSGHANRQARHRLPSRTTLRRRSHLRVVP